MITIFLFFTTRCSNLGFLLTQSGLEAVKTQIVRDLTNTLKNIKLPDLVPAQVNSQDMKVSDIYVRKIDLKPENLKIELGSGGIVLVKVSGVGADLSSTYELKLLLGTAKGRAKIVTKNVAADFKLKLGFEAGRLTTQCFPNDIKITIGELTMEYEKVEGSSFDVFTKIVFMFKDTIKNQATDIANKNAKKACEELINPNLRALDFALKVDEPMTRSKFEIAFAPAKEPTFVQGGLFYQTDIQMDFDATKQIDNSKAKLTPTQSPTDLLNTPTSPIDSDMIIAIRQELISDALNLLFSTKKQFKVKIVAAEDSTSKKSPKPIIVTASPTLLGKPLPPIDLTETINKLGLISSITSLGFPTIAVELPNPPTFSIVDQGLLVKSQVRCTIELNHKDHRFKLEDEGFEVTMHLGVNIEKVEDAQKKPGSDNRESKAAPQFNAVVKPLKVSVKYAPWPAQGEFKPPTDAADAIAHFINPAAEHYLALMPPIVVPLPVKEELRAMGIPGNPTNLFIKFSKDKTMTIALKGEFDFKNLIDAVLNPQVEQVSILGMATGAKKVKVRI